MSIRCRYCGRPCGDDSGVCNRCDTPQPRRRRSPWTVAICRTRADSPTFTMLRFDDEDDARTYAERLVTDGLVHQAYHCRRQTRPRKSP